VSQTVLIVDDELDIQSSLSLALRDEGYHVLVATLPDEALEILSKEVVDVGLFDIWFPKGDGIDLLKKVRQSYPRILPIMMSGHGTIEMALSAIRLGAYDFLEKPLELEKVLVVLKNALETRDLRNENERLNDLLFEKGQMLGSSKLLSQLKAQIQRASIASSPVTLVGELGVGKNLCARLLHDLSSRKKQPLVTWSPLSHTENTLSESLFGSELNQNAIPSRKEGALEYVREGTLVIADLEKIPTFLQNRLAEVIKRGSFLRENGKQSLPFKGRIVATSPRPLSEEQRFGKITPDLFHLLNGIEIQVPALRDRKEDVIEIFEYFLGRASADQGIHKPQISNELISWLTHYEWPGNVRELKNITERILILAGQDQKVLHISDLPEEIQNAASHPDDFSDVDFRSLQDPDGPLRKLRGEFEKSIIMQRLHKLGGNVTKTADSLGIERAHLHRKMRQFGLHSSRDPQNSHNNENH
jgi:two-component system nitrogen regulation response regulator NtrX